MKRNVLILAIILLIGLIVNSCEDQKEEPVQQKYEINGITTAGGVANVTVYYMVLPGTATPGYMSEFETAIKNVLSSSIATGNLTINVIAGNSGFAKTSSKTLSVGASWLTANNSEQAIGPALAELLTPWVAMNKNQNRVCYAGGMSPFEQA